MYSVTKYHITMNKYPALFEYCTIMSERSKSLRNAALFRVRQWFTAYGKDYVQPNQQEVIDEVHLTMKLSGRKKPLHGQTDEMHGESGLFQRSSFPDSPVSSERCFL